MRLIERLRELYAGSRLVICAFLGIAVFFALGGMLRPVIRIVTAWDAGILLFLLGTLLAIGDASPGRMRRRARDQDERAWVILTLIVVAAGLSFLALGFMVHKEEGESFLHLALRIGLVATTVFCSWTLVHTIFALHYTHLYYGDRGASGEADTGGLEFPGDAAPDYWDFLYFSFVIGMTCQVSDVQVSSRPMRRLALLHGVLSFFFNTVILALTINILASAL